MPNQSVEEILAEFNQNKRTWEVYSALGMGIAYPKLEDWLVSKLTQLQEQTRAEELERIKYELFKLPQYHLFDKNSLFWAISMSDVKQIFNPSLQGKQR